MSGKTIRNRVVQDIKGIPILNKKQNEKIKQDKTMEENFSHQSKIYISPIVGATMDNGVVIQPVIDDEVGVLQNMTMRFKKLKYGKSFRKKLVHCIRNEKIAQRRAMRKQQEKHNRFLSIISQN